MLLALVEKELCVFGVLMLASSLLQFLEGDGVACVGVLVFNDDFTAFLDCYLFV